MTVENGGVRTELVPVSFCPTHPTTTGLGFIYFCYWTTAY